MDLKEIGWKTVNWMCVAWDVDQWHDNIGVHKSWGAWLSRQLNFLLTFNIFSIIITVFSPYR